MSAMPGAAAPDFTLPATDGRTVSLADVMGENGAVIAFICNHCPYVVSSARRMAEDARALMGEGFGFAAICANDAERYPADSFDRMKDFAAQNGFPFPYLYDESQEVARAYGAVCTPDFFGFDAGGGLQYRGRLDASRNQAGAPDLRRDLFEAMKQVADTGRGPREQIPSIGCSIKWKAG